jgi:hypothetical protein
MHISLDSALGRQRRLNQVGETISSIATPAAAYSLRSLTGGDPKVVRVRRSSDDDEQDFTASEVASGAMLSYVNTQAIKPLDIKELATGTSDDGRNGNFILADAAYSLRSLGTRQATIPNDVAPLNADTVVPASGKYVVQVRRNVNGDQKSFTADEVSDGTLASFVNESFTSSLPLDVQSSAAAYSLRNLSSSYSGNVVEVRRSSDGNAENFTAAEVTDGTLLSFVNKDVITEQSDFTSGVDSYAKDSQGTVSREASFEGKSDVLKYEFASTGRFGFKKTSIALDLTSSYTISFEYYADSEYNGKFWGIEDAFASRASAASNSPTVVSGAWTSATLNVPSGRATGISTLHIRAQDAASDTLGLTGITANVRFKNIVVTQLTGSGFVKTWYDQVGSNHAAQTDADKQPTIASNGSLLADGIDFDGTDDELETGANISGSAISGFVVANLDGTAANSLYSVGDSKPNVLFGNPSLAYVVNGGVALSGGTAPTNTDTLFTQLFISGGTSKTFIDGSAIASGDAGSNTASSDKLTIGNLEGIDRFMDGSIKEIIIYDTDQTDNRRALEESIAGHYDGITLGSFSRDGFVRTWYDQSVSDQAGTARGNHVVQTSVSSMPKIVENGSLLTPGVKFEGAQTLSASDPIITAASSGTYSAFSVQTVATSEAGYLYGNASGSNGTSIYALSTPTFTISNTSATNLDNITRSSGQNLLSAVYNSGDAGLLVNGAGTMSDSGTYNFSAGSSNFIIGNRNGSSADAAFLTGSINEIIIYNSNQSTNRTAIEANMGSAHGINLPDGFDPTNDKVNGLVERWYDQSGQSRDSIQSTASFQPIIVDEGVFQDGLKFTHADSSDTNNKRLYVPLSQSQLDPFTYVFVGKVTIANNQQRNLLGGTRGIQDFPPGTAGISIEPDAVSSTSGTVSFRNETSTTEFIKSASSTAVSTGASAQDFLAFVTFEDGASGPVLELSVNGNKQDFAYESGLSLSSSKDIGIMNATKDVNSAAQYRRDRSPTGICREILVYDTFQSANRVVLENNINNQYSLF